MKEVNESRIHKKKRLHLTESIYIHETKPIKLQQGVRPPLLATPLHSLYRWRYRASYTTIITRLSHLPCAYSHQVSPDLT